MFLQGIEESGELLEPGIKSDIKMALCYVNQLRLAGSCTGWFAFDTECTELLAAGGVADIKRQVRRLPHINDELP